MTWLVVGLGNPGRRYERTRHNIGHLVAAELADRLDARFKAHRDRLSETTQGRIGAKPAVVARSRGYMNESGGPVKALMGYYDVPAGRLIVIHDELDLDPGSLRVKYGGGDNGHNGLKSIRSAIGTGEYARVRCGIGRPDPGQTVFDYVLKPFSKAERAELPLQVVTAADAVESLIELGLESTQNAFNR